MFLLDTDIISYLMLETPPPPLTRRAAQEKTEHQHLSAITVAEVAFGAHRSGRPGYYIDRFRQVISGLRIAAFDLDAAWRYGELRAELERRGAPLAEPDLRIASIALARGLVLVTHNRRHFKRVPGLVLQDWATEG
ncbi:MAG: PIN domain-containing protein [Deltaproteobacteria bacterium]|nr:PIN domain-containing protein [Deltaproteobacteria bacterium]